MIYYELDDDTSTLKCNSSHSVSNCILSLSCFCWCDLPNILSTEVLEVLRDLDETSKRKVDILQHFLVNTVVNLTCQMLLSYVNLTYVNLTAVNFTVLSLTAVNVTTLSIKTQSYISNAAVNLTTVNHMCIIQLSNVHILLSYQCKICNWWYRFVLVINMCTHCAHCQNNTHVILSCKLILI